jgi:microcystin-dependent protein
MPFIIPNAIDTTSGNKYSSLDQSEPDSIDFEVLGNTTTGVISGCAVSSATVPGSAVAVSGGVILLNGIVYTVNANSYLALPSPPSTTRFDAVVARLSGSTVTLTCLYGAESATNPALPKSKSRIVSTAGLNPLSYFNPDTDVLLSTIFRSGSSSVTASEIVDKRKSIQTPIPFRGTTPPQQAVGSVGDFYLQTGSLGIGSSGVYVKRASNDWVELANVQADPGVPIGTVITWVARSSSPNSAVWTECDGRALDPVVYPLLFGVIDYDFGQESGSERFYLPDLRGCYTSGVPSSGGTVGSVVGNDSSSATLTESNLPRHRHSMDHGHSGVVTEPAGRHLHDYRRNYFNSFNAVAGPGDPNVQSNANVTSKTEYADDHYHNVTIASSAYTTGYAGQVSPDPIDLRPKTMYVKHYIRYA